MHILASLYMAKCISIRICDLNIWTEECWFVIQVLEKLNTTTLSEPAPSGSAIACNVRLRFLTSHTFTKQTRINEPSQTYRHTANQLQQVEQQNLHHEHTHIHTNTPMRTRKTHRDTEAPIHETYAHCV